MIVLVTGASSGIGRQIAIQLSESYRLILHGRDLQRLEETRQVCRSPEQHIAWQMDLKETTGIGDSLRIVLSRLEAGVHGFVHCAGALQVLPIRSITPSIVTDTMNVNFGSALEITRILASKKTNQKNLRNVVFVSSTASKFGAKGFGLYCASKGALDSLMRAIAVELAPRVRVNSVLPGAIKTDMTDDMMNDPDLAARIQSQYPLGVGKTSDIASAVEFLLSDNSRWVTGHQLVVDGGCTADITA